MKTRALNVRYLLLLLLSACAEQPQWVRMDGGPISPNQLNIDVSSCRDELAKLETPKGVTGPAIRQAFEADVMRGCMARRGYLQAK